MTRSRPLLLVFLAVAAGLLGCDTTVTPPESQVVVQAYLQAQAPLDTVQLTRTVGARDSFDPRAAAVQGADVEIRRLEGGTVVETTRYREKSTPGVYAPVPAAPPSARPTATYQLHVETDDGTTITSTTTVPDSIELVNAENTTAEYQNPAEQPALTIVPPRPLTGDRQNVYTFTVTSLLDFENTPDTTLAKQFTPFYADQYDADEDSIESFRISSSGLLNQGNFTENADGTITVELPWIGVAFYGPNEVAINAVDDNVYDFLRSASAQQGAFAPGEIPNVIEHVEGGTGIFGSYSRAAINVQVKRPSSGES